MSYTYTTPNIHLPQYQSSDIPSYLEDMNGAYEAIDTAIKNADDKATVADGKATTASQSASVASSAAASAQAGVSNLKVNVAPVYSQTDTYVVGDYRIYDDLLYRCIVPITVPEVFNPNKWERASLTGQIKTLDGRLSVLESTALVKNATVIGADTVINEYTTWTSTGPTSMGGFTLTVEAPYIEGYTAVGVADAYITGSGSSGCSIRGWNFLDDSKACQILAVNLTKSSKTWHAVADFLYVKSEFIG